MSYSQTKCTLVQIDMCQEHYKYTQKYISDTEEKFANTLLGELSDIRGHVMSMECVVVQLITLSETQTHTKCTEGCETDTSTRCPSVCHTRILTPRLIELGIEVIFRIKGLLMPETFTQHHKILAKHDNSCTRLHDWVSLEGKVDEFYFGQSDNANCTNKDHNDKKCAIYYEIGREKDDAKGKPVYIHVRQRSPTSKYRLMLDFRLNQYSGSWFEILCEIKNMSASFCGGHNYLSASFGLPLLPNMNISGVKPRQVRKGFSNRVSVQSGCRLALCLIFRFSVARKRKKPLFPNCV